MKPLVLLVALLAGPFLSANPIVVFAKNDTLVLDGSAASTSLTAPAKIALVAAVKADLVHPAAYAPAIALSAPPSWGRTIAGAAGQLEFHATFAGGFFVRVSLSGLAPDHRYILTLNGKPTLAGNERLADPVPGLPEERYFDFLTIKTDEHGSYAATVAIALLPGPYDVRFYVKDTADFKIVLYHDYFKFSAQE